MATRRMRGLVLSGAMLAALPACGGTVGVGGVGGTGATGGAGAVVDPGTKYEGQGFIVHEWGTDTVVVGSDGSAQRGLHHEEEDLPAFVYDRMNTINPRGASSVAVKMETPVTYFYSDEPRTVNASVAFPKGVFTQWYPAPMAFWPPVIGAGAKAGVDALTDPVFDLGFPFDTAACAATYGSVADGTLDWGAVQVQGREADGNVYLEAAPLEQYTWSYARQVASNPVLVPGVPDENEKFLFYRGLGDFTLPVTVSAPGAPQVHLQNDYAEPIGPVFVIHVDQGQGAFAVHAAGIAAGGALDLPVPAATGMKLDAFADALAGAVTSALDATGLYHDEAVAMVNTWRRQWFKTPGIRVLYLMPQSWTDASIPLTILPAPDATVRVMMIRTEVITPDLEAEDQGFAAMLGASQAEGLAQDHFHALGRFAEPRLRRALQLLGDPAAAQPFLASLATAETRQATGE